MREFNPTLCCEHDWVYAGTGARFYVCTKCNSTCNRGEAGDIIAYDAGPGIMHGLPSMAHWGQLNETD